MPPLFRVDVGKQVFYCLDEGERDALLARIEREKIKGAISVTRFKGLGEMNPSQLRESTIHPDTRIGSPHLAGRERRSGFARGVIYTACEAEAERASSPATAGPGAS